MAKRERGGASVRSVARSRDRTADLGDFWATAWYNGVVQQSRVPIHRLRPRLTTTSQCESARSPTLIEMRELKYFSQETLRTLPIRMYDGRPPGLPDETRQMLHMGVNEKRQALGLPPVGPPYTWRVPHTLPDQEARRAPESRPPQVVPLPPPPFAR